MTDALPGKEGLRKVLLPPHAETRIIDAEVLLQEIFNTDPRQGCSLLFRLYFAPLCSHVIRFVYAKQVAGEIKIERRGDKIFLHNKILN
jgi:hypothetical protein